MKQKKRTCVLILVMILVVAVAFPVFAETAKKKKTVKKKKPAHKNEWVISGNNTYYYDKSGKKVRGMQTIKKKQYYFEMETGKQLVGWRHIKGSYYYFRISPGKGGYMLKKCKVNGISLNKTGQASVKFNSNNYYRVRLMNHYQRWVDELNLYRKSGTDKLYAILSCLRRFRYRNEPEFYFENPQWAVMYAREAYQRRNQFMPSLECFRFSCAFGFLANAAVLSNVEIVCNPGHGYNMVGGVVYDSTKAINRQDMSYFPNWDALGEYEYIRAYVASF